MQQEKGLLFEKKGVVLYPPYEHVKDFPRIISLREFHQPPSRTAVGLGDLTSRPACNHSTRFQHSGYPCSSQTCACSYLAFRGLI